MRAITFKPGVRGSVRVEEVAEPGLVAGMLLVRALALGICATDRDIAAAEYGQASPGEGTKPLERRADDIKAVIDFCR